MLIGEVSPADKQDDVDNLIVDLAILQEQTLANTNFCFDKTVRDFPSPKEYRAARRTYNRAAFSALHDRFNKALSEIVHRMNEIAGLAKA